MNLKALRQLRDRLVLFQSLQGDLGLERRVVVSSLTGHSFTPGEEARFSSLLLNTWSKIWVLLLLRRDGVSLTRVVTGPETPGLGLEAALLTVMVVGEEDAEPDVRVEAEAITVDGVTFAL